MTPGGTAPKAEMDRSLVVAAGLVGAALVGGAAVWAGAECAALLVHAHVLAGGLSVLPDVVIGLLRHPADPGLSWPAAQRHLIPGPVLVYALAGVWLGTAGLAGALLRRAARGRRSRPGMASRAELAGALSVAAVRRRAAQVRPSLNTRRPQPDQVGVYLGDDATSGAELWASLEDSFLVLGPPRSGKGVHLVIPGVLSAPGAVVVTSTRPDVAAHTAAARPGPVAVFDPQCESSFHRPLRWSPVAGAEAPLTAILRAGGFATGAGFGANSANDEFWTASAAAVIRAYLHAAAVAGYSMVQVLEWAHRPAHPEPIALLRSDGAAPGWADSLAALAGSEPETRDGIWAGVQRAFDCFADPRVLAACSPPPGEAFDAEGFLRAGGSLYVLGSSRAQLSVAPLISALVEDVTEAAHRLANSSPHGRLDPPLSLWLDEAANIAPLPSLPHLLAAGGGSGICTVVVLQSLAQARARWGPALAEALWDAATVRVVLGGLGNAEDLSAISRLAGETDEVSYSYSSGEGGRSRSTSLRSRPVLSPERLRTLAPDRAVVLHRRTPPVEAAIAPWWERPCAQAVSRALADGPTEVAVNERDES